MCTGDQQAAALQQRHGSKTVFEGANLVSVARVVARMLGGFRAWAHDVSGDRDKVHG